MRIFTFNLSQQTTAKSRRRDNDPWIEGYEARVALTARSANPYAGPDSRGLWDEGWMEAQGESQTTENRATTGPCRSRFV
jgi:ribosome modulation factor